MNREETGRRLRFLTDDNLQLIHVHYVDHVLYNRAPALAMQPQVREAVGWLVYECDQYITLSWDRDADPPTLHGGDAKASGMVLLKSDIISLERLNIQAEISHGTVERVLNSPEPNVKDEYAFRTSERKTHRPRKGTAET
jgi:hypothetical protein